MIGEGDFTAEAQRAQSFRREIFCPKYSSSTLSAFVGNNFMMRDFTAKTQWRKEKFSVCLVTLWEINLFKGLILQRSKNPLDKRRDEQV